METYHADNRTGREKFAKARVKFFFRQISIVILCHFKSRPNHFQPNKLVTALFEPSNDVTNQTTLNAIGFNSQECTLLVGSSNSGNRESITFDGTLLIDRIESYRTCSGGEG